MRYRGGVRTPPPPALAGNTDADRMDNAVRGMFTAPSAEVLKREAEWQRDEARERRTKKTA